MLKNISYHVSRLLCVIFFKFFLHIKVYGKKNIPRKGGFILASNHKSYLDPVALGVASPRKLNYMARHDLFSNPIFAWFLYSYGVFPIKRETADISSLKEAIRRVRRGQPLLLFPEGTRTDGSKEIQPQAGVGFLAAKLQVPVVPAFIKGTEKAMPKHAKFIHPAKISVHFGEQIHVERRMPYQDIAELIMKNIRHLSCL